MKLSTPKNITFYISIALAVIGLLVWFFSTNPVIGGVLLIAGFVLLALGNLLEGL